MTHDSLFQFARQIVCRVCGCPLSPFDSWAAHKCKAVR